MVYQVALVSETPTLTLSVLVHAGHCLLVELNDLLNLGGSAKFQLFRSPRLQRDGSKGKNDARCHRGRGR